jgi:hypothetical protein
MKTLATTFTAILLAGSLGVALAAENDVIRTVQAAPMTDTQIQQKLESEGYTNVQITGHEKTQIDATATKNGATQKLSVDAQTGNVAAGTDTDDDD